MFPPELRDRLLRHRILVLDGPLDDDNGTVLTTAGTAGPTTTGNAATTPTNAAGSDSEGSAARMGMEAAGLAAIGVVGAMLVM